MKKKMRKVRKVIWFNRVILYGSEGAINNCDCNLRVGC